MVSNRPQIDHRICGHKQHRKSFNFLPSQKRKQANAHDQFGHHGLPNFLHRYGQIDLTTPFKFRHIRIDSVCTLYSWAVDRQFDNCATMNEQLIDLKNCFFVYLTIYRLICRKFQFAFIFAISDFRFGIRKLSLFCTIEMNIPLISYSLCRV